MAQQPTTDARNSPEITVMPLDGDRYLLTCPVAHGPAPDAVQVWYDHHEDVLLAQRGEAGGRMQYEVEVLA